MEIPPDATNALIISPEFILCSADGEGSNVTLPDEIGFNSLIWMRKASKRLSPVDEWDNKGVCIDVSGETPTGVVIAVKAETPDQLRTFFRANLLDLLRAGAQISIQNAA